MTNAYLAPEGFTFGCDPEMFVVNENDELVSAHGLIPGTKEAPHKVENGAIQVDGMAAEFNIDPVSTFEEFNRNIVSVVKQLKAALPRGYGLKVVPAVRFSQSVMDAQPDTAKVLGCDPDYNAWTGEINPTPDMLVDPLLRTASGHLHYGWTEDMPVTDEVHTLHCRDLVKQLDWFLGAWSVKKDPDVTRRQLYGKAGAYRPKPYGVEYRVLSNFWIKDKATRLAVWNRMVAAIDFMSRKEFSKKRGGSENDHNPALIEAINTGQVNTALEAVYAYPLQRI